MEDVTTQEWASNCAAFFQQKLLLTAKSTSKNKTDMHKMKMRDVVERRKQKMREGYVYDQTIHKWVNKDEFDTSHELGWKGWLASEWRKKNKTGIPKLGDLINVGSMV